MAYWEFLLQKEGDRDWLPLETAHVEISEGRYRIIAHTSYCETAVDIRLVQHIPGPPSPQRRAFKRVGQTNSNGLMVVIPFTHLTPGSWTIQCSAIATATSLDQPTWHYGVQVQVIAIESGVEYWDTELDEATLSEQLSTTAPSSGSQTLPSDAEPPSAADIVSVIDAAAIPETTFTASAPLEDLPLRLQLRHQALVAQSRSSVTLQGQVTSFSEVAGLPDAGTLWIQLRNPETGDVIHQVTHALSVATLPSRFDLPLALPDNISTRLLVGELSLWTATEPPQILAIQGFTITLNLDALLEVVANQAERSLEAALEEVPQSTATGDTAIEDTDAATPQTTEPPSLSTLSPREIPFRLVYLPSTGLTLPPVIYRPIDKKAVGAPSLPSFSSRSERDRPIPTSPEGDQAEPSPPLGDTASSRPSATEAAESPPPPSKPSIELPSFGRSRPSQTTSDTTHIASGKPAPPDSSATEAEPQPAFQPDFQGRFWTRLSALAEEAQKAAADYKAQLEAAGVETSRDRSPSEQSPLQLLDLSASPADQNYEFVVYDESVEKDQAATGTEVTETPVVEVLQPGEPEVEDLGSIPVPELVLPQSELIAGAPLPITVKLPTYPRRLAVKVWVTDIQSRTLADRPRWLMNWIPNDQDEQTAFLQLQVPMGSIEARFEAITIDLATQRESYKTTLVRSIAPTNTTDFDFDESL